MNELTSAQIAEKLAMQWYGDEAYEWRVKGLTRLILTAITEARSEPRSDVHDAEWALEYVAQHELEVVRCQSPTCVWGWTIDTLGLPGNRATGSTLNEAVENWKLKYAPDKVEPEETAEQLLKTIVAADCVGLSELEKAINEATDFLHRKSQGGSDHAE